jgi:protein tyrosine phosphatase (PTP) superfamily phosphohydrolase (DUF442 family)
MARPRHLDVSPVTDQLYVGAWPRAEHAGQIAALGIRLVLCMQKEPPARALGEPPLALLALPAWDSPLTFTSVEQLRQGVEAALPVLSAGDKVLAYCKSGRRRSAAMVAAILVAQGATADEALDQVKAARPVATTERFWVRRRLHEFEAAWRGQGA